MGIILLAGIAMAVGLLLVVLLTFAGPNPAAVRPAGVAGSEGALSADAAWLGGLSQEEFAKLLALLFEEMRFEVTPLESELGGGVILLAHDPTPIKGVKILVLGLHAVASGVVDADVVRRVMEMVRGEEAGKGAVVTAVVFTDDARKAAESLPVDLVDGAELLRLVKKHLPQVAAQKGV